MSGRKGLLTIGGVAAAGAGYYLYKAGGDPKVAEKQFEYDASKAARKLKGNAPGTEGEAKNAIKVSAAEAGQKVDRASTRQFEDVKATTSKVDAKLEAYRQNAEKKIDEFSKEAKKDFNEAAAKFDKTVEKKAAETKGWFSGWFGGK